jgi:ribonuclease HI
MIDCSGLTIMIGLVLYFDGSLRPPRDKGFPTEGLGRMASCGVAVFSDSDTLVALGGKSISLMPGVTSADVEYEGLLFGLDWLDRQWDGDEQVLIVRGDCKAIIDQLNGQSVPRKLRSKHKLALDLLGRIERQTKLVYEHVLRKENTLCDSICAQVMKIIEQQQVSMFRTEMAPLQEFTMNNAPQSTLTDLIKRYISSQKSLVRFSRRPELYTEAVSVAQHIGDAVALDHIGKQLVLEAKLWPAKENTEQMTLNGVSLQIRGLQMMERHKEAKQLIRKHRYLLDRSFANHDNTLSCASVTAAVESVSIKLTDGSIFGFGGGESEQLMLQAWYDRACRDDSEVLQGCWITT